MDQMKKAVISVLGLDRKGIIARVSNVLYNNDANILDISQTIVSGYFNMMMIADMSTSDKHFGEVCDNLTAIGDKIGVSIKCQKEEIFDSMHRI